MAITATTLAGRLNALQRGAFLGALIGWIFDYYEVFLMTMLAVPIAVEFKLTTAQVGMIFSVQLLFLAVGGVFFGYLADRMGRKRVLIYTILIFSLGTMARAAAPSYEVLLVLTAISAVGIGGEYGVGQTLVTETIDPQRRGFYSAFLYGGIYVGIILGALVGGHVTPVIGWRLTFLISGLPVLFALWVRRHTPESEVWLERTKAVVIVGCTVGAVFSDRLGRRFTLSMLAGSACIGGTWLALSWDSLLTGGAWILIPFFILFAGSNGAAIFGVLFSELFPAKIRATAVSSALQMGRGLSFFPPLIAAALLPRVGYQPIVFLSAALFGVLAVVAWLFPETRGVDVAAIDGISDHQPKAAELTTLANPGARP